MKYEVGEEVIIESDDGLLDAVVMGVSKSAGQWGYTVQLKRSTEIRFVPESQIFVEGDYYGDDPDQEFSDGTIVECVKLTDVPAVSTESYIEHRKKGAMGVVTNFFNKESLGYEDHVYHVTVYNQTTVFWASELMRVDTTLSEPVQQWLNNSNPNTATTSSQSKKRT